MVKSSKEAQKVILAYSGGLDTSIILTWLKEECGAEVITFTADVGQGDELDGLEEKALQTGATKAYIRDIKEEFVKDFVFPAIRANAIYEGQYLLGTALARPLISKHLVEIAKIEKADSISHGSTGKGNDQVRFELAAMALEPSIKCIAPWREWDLSSRTELIEYAKKHNIPIPVSVEKPYSTDRNLMHISFEGGILEDPWQEASEDMFVLTSSPEKAPDKVTYLEIDFEQGNPVALDGERLSPATLLAKLNDIAGKNGVGRIDIVENRFVGMKCRGVYETPGGTVLHIAHRALETLTLDREVMHLKDSLVPKYATLVYNGFWYAPERETLQAMIDHTQEKVTGVVRVKLYKGNCQVVGRKSTFSLYDDEFATFESDSVYDQSDAEGFIKCTGLRLRIKSALRKY